MKPTETTEPLHNAGDIIRQRYRVRELIGQGNAGQTYVADEFGEETNSGRRVAMKVLAWPTTDDGTLLELFEREATVLVTLRHRSIPQYLSFFDVDFGDERRFYLVQTLVGGLSLANLVHDGWQPDEATVRDVALQVLDVLAYLQERTPPVIHRDITPNNLIRRSNGSIALVDFGAVQAMYRQTIVKGNPWVGTQGYMPPEQRRGSVVPASDLYALGATLVFLLSGTAPEERQMQITLDRLPVSPHFAAWLKKMLDPVANQRFPNAVAALSALIDESSPLLNVPPNPSPNPSPNPPIAPSPIAAPSPLDREPLAGLPVSHLDVHAGQDYLSVAVQPEGWTWRSRLMRWLCWGWILGLGCGVLAGAWRVLTALWNAGLMQGVLVAAGTIVALSLPVLLGLGLLHMLRSMGGVPTHIDLDASRVRVRQPRLLGATLVIDCPLRDLLRVEVDAIPFALSPRSLQFVRYTLVTATAPSNPLHPSPSFQVLLNAAEQDWLTRTLRDQLPD